jgi:hypothetical protein
MLHCCIPPPEQPEPKVEPEHELEPEPASSGFGAKAGFIMMQHLLRFSFFNAASML